MRAVLLALLLVGGPAVGKPLRLVASPLLAPVTAAWAKPLSDTRRRTANALTAVQALIHGRADVIAIARPLTPAERRLFTGALLSLPVGLDAVAVYVHRDVPLRYLSLGALERLFFAANHCNPPAPPLPPLRRFGLAAAAARHFQFRDRVGCGAPLAAPVRRLPTNREVIAAVAATAGAIGFASASLTAPAAVRRIALARRPADRPVWPDRAALRQGRYPLTHYLYLHLRPDQPRAVALARQALSPPGQASLARRFMALPEPLRRRALQTLAAAVQ